MQIGTKVTYTKKGYARDYIYTMTNLTEINNLKKEDYAQRKGIVTNIGKTKCGLITYEIKWEYIGGYFQDDTSYVQEEDIQEIEQIITHTNKRNTMKQDYFYACPFVDEDGNESWKNYGGVFFFDGIDYEWIEDTIGLTQEEAEALSKILNETIKETFWNLDWNIINKTIKHFTHTKG